MPYPASDEVRYCACGCGALLDLTTGSRSHKRWVEGHRRIKPRTPEYIGSVFWPKVAKAGPDDCWLWQGPTVKQGNYVSGRIRILYKSYGAHRLAYWLTYGDIPEGLNICHTCDTPLCCNPAHLFPGTQSENMQDCVAKGRHTAQVHPECLPRGDRAPARVHIDKMARGTAHYAARYTEDDIRKIRQLHDDGWTNAAIGTLFGRSGQCMSDIILRKTWKSVE